MGLFRNSANQRGQSVLGSVGVGFMLFIAGMPTLFLNEGRAVKTARSLKEGAAAVVSVDSSNVAADNDGKFVHVSGNATTDQTLTDDQFGVSVNAIRLNRNIEMFQWQEQTEKVTRRGEDGKSTESTEYSYSKGWASEHVDSAEFHEPSGHSNPSAIPFASKTTTASPVSIGAFTLSPELVGRIDQPEPLVVDDASLPEALSDSVRPKDGGFYWSSVKQTKAVSDPSTPVIEEPASEEPASEEPLTIKPLTLESGTKEPVTETLETETPEPVINDPNIGDTRIHFTATYPTEVSVMAQQTGATFQPFRTANGRELNMLSMGQVSAEAMIQKAVSENTFFTWVLRLLGSAFLIFGIGLILRPLTAMTERIPILGNLVGMGTAFVSVLLGSAIAFLLIGTAWIFYRPLIGIPLIAVSIGLLVFIVKSSRDRKGIATS